MAKSSLNEEFFDRPAYDNTNRKIKRAQTLLPQDSVSFLAREVVRRLAFRMPQHSGHSDVPTADEISLLCAGLLSSDDSAADHFIQALRRDGVAPDVISTAYIGAAARQLGEMWNDDRISFVDVTLACGKLYAIIRALRHVLAPVITAGRDECPVLFALVPGETHTLGIEIAAEHFRSRNWEVDLLVGLDHDMLLNEADRRAYQAIILVANSNDMMQPLTRLCLELRISQPLAHVVIAGNITTHHPGILSLVGAEAALHDLDTAVAQMTELLARRTA